MRVTGVKFEKLQIGNREEYIDFLIEAYKDQFNSRMFKDRAAVGKRWLWEYMDSPCRIEERPLIWIARIDDRMAAQMCVMPVEMKVLGKAYRAGWCQDFIVLPEYRKRGLGFSIVEHVTEEARKHVDILLAFVASDASYKVFQRASYIDAGFTRRNVMVVDPERVSGIVFKNSLLRISSRIAIKLFFGSIGALTRFGQDRELTIDRTSSFGDEFDDLYSKVSATASFAMSRGSETLRWRFLDQPVWDYTIFSAKKGANLKGYGIVRNSIISGGRFKGLRVGILSDILFDAKEKSVGRALVHAAIGYFIGNADIVQFDFLNKDLAGIARREGFLNIKSRNRFYVNPLSEELKAVGHNALTNGWHLTYSDSDLDLF